MAAIRIDPSRKHEFDRLYSAWKWGKEKGELAPEGLLLSIGLPTPLDHVPGQFGYTGVEEEFLDVLSSKGFPFTPI